MTPDSTISRIRSLPSRQRSPTPARPSSRRELGHVVDKFLNNHRLAHAGAAEDARLAATSEGGNQVDDLDARFKISACAACSAKDGAMR